jgi:acyl carrier protein
MSTQPVMAADARGQTGNPLFDQVHRTVEDAIVNVVGRWYYDECQVALDSTFAEDIELESMEVMEISESLIDTYEGRVDFVTWFSAMELEDLVELTLRDVVDFIVRSLEQRAA